jgi:hypothetical protein
MKATIKTKKIRLIAEFPTTPEKLIVEAIEQWLKSEPIDPRFTEAAAMLSGHEPARRLPKGTKWENLPITDRVQWIKEVVKSLGGEICAVEFQATAEEANKLKATLDEQNTKDQAQECADIAKLLRLIMPFLELGLIAPSAEYEKLRTIIRAALMNVVHYMDNTPMEDLPNPFAEK